MAKNHKPTRKFFEQIPFATREAFRKYAELFSGNEDPPASSPPGAASGTAASSPPSSPTASPPATPVPMPTGPQVKRAIRALRKLFAPHGKIPADMSIDTARGQIASLVEKDNKQIGKGPPGWDAVNAAVEYLGRAEQ
jgi:hypothetical protein